MASEEVQARRVLRRAVRAARRANRRERRVARRADIAALLLPLVQAAEGLFTEGADRLVWVVDQFLACIDIPGLDEDALAELVEASVETILATVFRPRT
tara:strand:+ start:100 stop:396 length:297 start_codon:yes stop_codon:yes gene_type:complete